MYLFKKDVFLNGFVVPIFRYIYLKIVPIKETASVPISNIGLFCILLRIEDKYSDNVFTFLIGLYIIYVSWKLLRENISNVIGASVVDDDYLDRLKNMIRECGYDLEIDKVNLIRYGTYNIGHIELSVNGGLRVYEVDRIIQVIKDRICDSKLKYVMISVVSK